MKKALAILLIGLLTVAIIGAVVVAATLAVGFFVVVPVQSESNRGLPTEVVAPQSTDTVQPTTSPATPTVITGDDCSPAETLTSENGRIAYWGIGFQLDPALATTVTVQHCQAVPCCVAVPNEPGHPVGMTFTFLTGLRRVYFPPQIAIYAVKGDMHLQDYPYPINALGDLKTLLSERPEPSPWFDDATLHVRAQYLDFAGGAGVRLITQDAHDYFFYTNNNIFYNFDGLTDDGRFYVNVRMPVAAPFLLDLDVGSPLINHNPNAIPIPTELPRYGNQQRPIIDAYNQEALRRFGQATDADFTPDLALLDALVRSLEITAP